MMAVFSTTRRIGATFLALAVLAPAICMARAKGEPPQPQCRVTISAEPASAAVTIDNAPLDAIADYAEVQPGMWEVRLQPGEYVVGFTAPGHDSAMAQLRVRQGDANALVARTLAKTTGLALLRSDPPGAAITIDGVSYGTTPRLITDLPLGTWQATYSLPGYKDQTIQFTMKDRSPVLAEARMMSDTATLEISANIEGVAIKVNGTSRGTAPCTIERVPAGEITIEASAPGYRDFIQQGRVGEAEILSIDVRMEPLPAALKVISLPDGARVYLDNNFKGETPMSFDALEPGVHRIRVEKAGFDPMARTVSLGRGDDATEEFRLRANTGTISFTSTPAGVAVFVDGVKVGETPQGEVRDLSGVLEIDGIAEGKHSLQFVKPGYFTKDSECEVRRGETTNQRIDLKRRFIPDYEVVTETGSHKGVFVEITGSAIRLETSPGIVSSYPLDKVNSHGKLK